MNQNLEILKNYIKNYSKNNLEKLVRQITDTENDIQKCKEYIRKKENEKEKKQLEMDWITIGIDGTKLKAIKSEIDTVKSEIDKVKLEIHKKKQEIDIKNSELIDLKNERNSLINRYGGRNLLILLKDGSRFLINMDIIYYMETENYIDQALMKFILDDTFTNYLGKENDLIQQLIEILPNDLTIILNDICLSKEECAKDVRLDAYLLNENMLKTLLLIYEKTFRFGQSVNLTEISLIYKRPVPSASNISHLLQECLDKSYCSFMFVIKKNNLIFGWILETIHQGHRINKHRVLLLFKIIDGILYTFSAFKFFYYLSFTNIHGKLSIIISEEKQVLHPEKQDPETLTIDILHMMDDNITFFLDNGHRKPEEKLNQLQIYEIGGRFKQHLTELVQQSPNQAFFLTEKIPEPGLRTFNYTFETIKQIKQTYDPKTKYDEEDEHCTVGHYCPTYHPYLCKKESEFRNKYRNSLFGKKHDGFSKGNNAPCVSEERFCKMDYALAQLQMNGQRTYSSKPIYCKTDQHTGDKQMIDTAEGGKYNKNKYRSSKMKISKRKNTKDLKIQKRSKRTIISNSTFFN
jgi:hypothetical protein